MDVSTLRDEDLPVGAVPGSGVIPERTLLLADTPTRA
jgi:hypothetical protein